jgi:uncharacterized membrane protein YczE
MSSGLRTSLHIVVLLMGIALMVGGIVTGEHGATVIGIIVAGVSVQQWMKWIKGRPHETKNSSTP